MTMKGKQVESECIEIGSDLNKATKMTLKKKVDWMKGQEVMIIGNNVTERAKIKEIQQTDIILEGGLKMQYNNSKDYANENRVCMMNRSVNVEGGYILNKGKQGDNFKTQIENVRLEGLGNKKSKSIIFSQNNQIPQSSFKNNVVMNCKNRALDLY